MKESESGDLKIEESESEVLCTDSTALVVRRTDFCEDGNEPSGSIKCRQAPDKLQEH
jgi:hypothetical protein